MGVAIAGDSGMSTSKTTGGQPGHSRSTTSAMTISDQSTTTGFGDSMPVLHQREISEASAMSGLASMDMPGPAGAYLSIFNTALAEKLRPFHVVPVALAITVCNRCQVSLRLEHEYAWHAMCRRVKVMTA